MHQGTDTRFSIPARILAQRFSRSFPASRYTQLRFVDIVPDATSAMEEEDPFLKRQHNGIQISAEEVHPWLPVALILVFSKFDPGHSHSGINHLHNQIFFWSNGSNFKLQASRLRGLVALAIVRLLFTHYNPSVSATNPHTKLQPDSDNQSVAPLRPILLALNHSAIPTNSPPLHVSKHTVPVGLSTSPFSCEPVPAGHIPLSCSCYRAIHNKMYSFKTFKKQGWSGERAGRNPGRNFFRLL